MEIELVKDILWDNVNRFLLSTCNDALALSKNTWYVVQVLYKIVEPDPTETDFILRNSSKNIVMGLQEKMTTLQGKTPQDAIKDQRVCSLILSVSSFHADSLTP
jgi:hypothetical protein